MNNEYWKKYYSNKDRQKPSEFLGICIENIDRKESVLEIGAGDGRDSYPIHSKVFQYAYIDPNSKLPFHRYESVKDVDSHYDIIYARWLIHAVSEKTENEIIDLAICQKSKLMLEFRIIGDRPDKTHSRRLIDLELFIKKLTDLGFVITYLKKGYGMSKLGKDDPYLARVVAEYQGC